MADTALQLRSTVKDDNTLELTLVDVPIPQPGPDEVLVRVEATPLNPSDLALLFGPADLSTIRVPGGDRGYSGRHDEAGVRAYRAVDAGR